MTPPGPGRTVTIRQVDAFTTVPFAGNSAGVVLDAAGLTDAQMQRIAREMNVAETAFLLPPSRAGADLRLRWFTPSVEVDLCGHATVATMHAAMEEGRLAPGSYRLECLAGVLDLGLSLDDGGRPRIRLLLPVPALSPWTIAGCRLTDPLGLEAEDLEGRLPPARAGRWGLAPLTGLEAMGRIRLDAAALRALCVQEAIDELIVLTGETLEGSSAVHLRMFAPVLGIDEDPVTGSAQGPVAAYLVANRLIGPAPGGEGPAIVRYVAEQGDELSRSGRIAVEATVTRGLVESIAISGNAVTVLKGTILLPPA